MKLTTDNDGYTDLDGIEPVSLYVAPTPEGTEDEGGTEGKGDPIRFRVTAEENAKLDAIFTAVGIFNDGQLTALRGLVVFGRLDASIRATGKNIARQIRKCEKTAQENLTAGLARLEAMDMPLVSLRKQGHAGQWSEYDAGLMRKALDRFDLLRPASVQAYPAVALRVINQMREARRKAKASASVGASGSKAASKGKGKGKAKAPPPLMDELALVKRAIGQALAKVNIPNDPDASHAGRVRVLKGILVHLSPLANAHGVQLSFSHCEQGVTPESENE